MFLNKFRLPKQYSLAILPFIFLQFALFTNDWPQFRGPGQDGISRAKGINQNWADKKFNILWKISMHDEGYAGPIVAGGILYIIDRDPDDEKDIVKAINMKNGSIKWTYSYKEPGRSNYGFAKTTPTYDNGRLYTLSKTGSLFCLNAESGKKLWNMNIVREFSGNLPRWDLAISPVIDGDKLIICPGGKKNVVALNKTNGKVIWKGGNSDLIGYATPVIATINSVKQYVFFSAYNLMGINPDTGAVMWKYPWRTSYDVNAATPVVFNNNYIFITSNYDKGCMLVRINKDNKQAVPQWKAINTKIASHFSTPVFYQNYIYSTDTSSGNLVCMEPLSGKVHWANGEYERGGLILADGVIIAIDGRRGKVNFIEANPKYKELAVFKGLGGQSWTAPIVADGKLIIRNRNSLACVELK